MLFIQMKFPMHTNYKHNSTLQTKDKSYTLLDQTNICL